MGGVGKTLGLSGEQAPYFQMGGVPELQRSAMSDLKNEATAVNTPTQLQQALLGGQQVSDFSKLGAPDVRALAESPIAGQRLAAQEVVRSPLSGGVYGDQGLQGSLQKEYQTYGGGGLTPEYQNELDKAMGNITRQYGGTEQGLAQALASRGLGAGPSGSAGVEYTGLMGNKNEQLAQAQMQAALDKLQAKRQLGTQMAQLAGQAGQAENQQYNQQLQGVASGRGAEQALGQQESTFNNAMLNRENIINQGNLESVNSMNANKAPTLGQAFGAGLMGSATSVGGAPGTFASSFAGGAGKALSPGSGMSGAPKP